MCSMYLNLPRLLVQARLNLHSCNNPQGCRFIVQGKRLKITAFDLIFFFTGL